MSSLVLYKSEEYITTLTLNRPERHNSIVPDLLDELLARLEEAERNEARTVVLQANGRSFSTGGDVRWFFDHRDNLEKVARDVVGLLNRVLLAMIALPAPIVAVVHGIVTGGSLGFVLASDFVLVSPEASFTPYYAPVGFSPDGGWTALLPWLIGVRRVEESLLTNRSIGAEQAVEWGIANRMVPADRIRAEGVATARSIAAMKSGSIKRAKRLAWGDLSVIASRLEQEKSQFVEQVVTSEAREGMEEFLSSRKR